MKHTQGPWHVESDADEFNQSLWVGSNEGDQGRMIAVVADTMQDLNTDLSNDEINANVRLIAAAPELLEAVQMLRDALEIAENANLNPNYSRIEFADKLIRKATGDRI